MRLLCLDLDNTLVDRTAGFRAWASEFVLRYRIEPLEVGWIMQIDLDGYADRAAVFQQIEARFGVASAEELLEDYRVRTPDLIHAFPGCLEALRRARTRGWSPWLVTNGMVAVQEGKLRGVGLDAVLDGWVISAGVGLRKPGAEIFHKTAELAGTTLDDAWMIGDSGHADIGGAHNAGIRSIWIHRHRAWDDTYFAPTHIAADIVEAIEVLGAVGD